MEYYSNDLVTLYHGDCAGELLPLLGECDVLITDPPLWGGKPALVFGSWKAPRPKGVKATIQWCKTNVGAGGGDLRVIAELNQKERFGPPMYSGGPTYRNVRGCETSHFLTSPLSAEQQHLNMINHLKGLRDTRGCWTP